MNPNKQIIEEFYAAFAAHNPDGMISCYHPEVVFRDPAFGTLHGRQAAAMWKMLIERSKGELELTFFNIEANNSTGSAKWRAVYIFSGTGRSVINDVSADFEFKDGLIIRHTDYFDIWKWSRQALGIKGLLFGWTGFLQGKVQKQARAALEKYLKVNLA